MSVWSGWQDDLLSHAGIPTTADNERFLNEWHSHAETNCNRNPIDLSVVVGTTRNCHALPVITAHAQNYTTTGNAVHAFDVQIHQASYSDLLAAMLSGEPYTAPNAGLVAQDLTAWGSRAFAHAYFTETAGAGAGIASDVFKGWHDLRRSVNTNMPHALHHSEQQMGRALRALGRARRVKL